jgi:hypothetical protein
MAMPAIQTHAFRRLDQADEDTAQVEMNGQQQLLSTAAQSLLTQVNAQGVWLDHATAKVFEPRTQTTLMPWAFKPNYWHWLEAGWVKP